MANSLFAVGTKLKHQCEKYCLGNFLKNRQRIFGTGDYEEGISGFPSTAFFLVLVPFLLPSCRLPNVYVEIGQIL